MSRRVLIIEDDADIAQLVALHLRALPCDVDVARSGALGLSKALTTTFDLIVLDLVLPDIGGLDICRRLRDQKSYTPILMLTAKSEELDRVLGLETGADDYLTKPFSILELMARIKALFRRIDVLQTNSNAEAGETLEADGLIVDVGKRKVTVEGQVVDLTTKEFDLLHHFAQSPGRVYNRTQLLEAVWGHGHSGYEHTVNSHINRLRSKIEANPSSPRYVLTVRGIGYKFRDDEIS